MRRAPADPEVLDLPDQDPGQDQDDHEKRSHLCRGVHAPSDPVRRPRLRHCPESAGLPPSLDELAHRGIVGLEELPGRRLEENLAAVEQRDPVPDLLARSACGA